MSKVIFEIGDIVRFNGDNGYFYDVKVTSFNSIHNFGGVTVNTNYPRSHKLDDHHTQVGGKSNSFGGNQFTLLKKYSTSDELTEEFINKLTQLETKWDI